MITRLPFPQPVEGVLHLHGGHDLVGGQPIQPGMAVEHLRLQVAGDVANSGADQSAVEGDDAEDASQAAEFLRQGGSQFLHLGWIGLVEQDAHDAAVMAAVGIHRDPYRPQGIGGGAAIGVAEDQDRAAEAAGDLLVEFEFEGRALPQKIGPFAEHEIPFPLQGLVAADDDVEPLMDPVGRHQIVDLIGANAVGLRIVWGRWKVRRISSMSSSRGAPAPRPLRAGFRRGTLDHGPEEPHPAGAAQQLVKQAQRHQGLAAPCLRGADVEGVAHRAGGGETPSIEAKPAAGGADDREVGTANSPGNPGGPGAAGGFFQAPTPQ